MTAMATILDFWSEWFSYLDILVTPKLSITLQDNRPFVSGEEAKKLDFQDGGHGGHLGFPIGTILAIFYLPSFMSICLSFQEKKRKIDFQDGGHGGHLGFRIGTILAIYALQDTSILPIKFHVNLPFGSGEEEKNRFSKWWPWRPSWI